MSFTFLFLSPFLSNQLCDCVLRGHFCFLFHVSFFLLLCVQPSIQHGGVSKLKLDRQNYCLRERLENPIFQSTPLTPGPPRPCEATVESRNGFPKFTEL